MLSSEGRGSAYLRIVRHFGEMTKIRMDRREEMHLSEIREGPKRRGNMVAGG